MMKKIMTVLMTVSMILAMVPLGMADSAGSSAEVNDVDPEYVLTVDYSDPNLAGPSSDGTFSATLVVSDNNGEDDIITTGYTISWTDEAGSQSALLTEDTMSDTDPLTRTFTGTGAVPYYQDHLDEITVTDVVGSATDTFTIVDEIVSVTAANVIFDAADPGVTITTTADVTNNGNNERSITAIVPGVLTGSVYEDTIPGSVISYGTLPFTVNDLTLETDENNPLSISYSLTVPIGTRGDAYSGSITYTVT